MSFNRKFKRSQKQNFQNEVYTHMTMTYGCDTCGETTLMYLEQGLEDDSVSAEHHKPVPFAIPCPHCNRGNAKHINWWLDEKFERLVKKDPATINYFANIKGEDCGVPKFNALKERENNA